MKTISRLCAIAIFSLCVASCTKTDLNQTVPNPVTAEPTISSRIERNIVEPGEMELGTPAAIIHGGERITIFVPYSIINEAFTSSRITMTDEATGETIDSYDLVPSTDPSGYELNKPSSMHEQPNFFFVTFVANESYVGKTVAITTTLQGQVTLSTDVLNSAFTVVP